MEMGCTQAIELIKQFLTLSSAGVAFVVGLVFADKPVKLPSDAVKGSLILFGISIVCGYLSYMAIVGKLGNEGRYGIYGRPIQIPAMLQVLCFGIGVALLAVPTIRLAGTPPAATSTAPLEVRLMNLPAPLFSGAASTPSPTPAASPISTP